LDLAWWDGSLLGLGPWRVDALGVGGGMVALWVWDPGMSAFWTCDGAEVDTLGLMVMMIGLGWWAVGPLGLRWAWLFSANGA